MCNSKFRSIFKIVLVAFVAVVLLPFSAHAQTPIETVGETPALVPGPVNEYDFPHYVLPGHVVDLMFPSISAGAGAVAVCNGSNVAIDNGWIITPKSGGPGSCNYDVCHWELPGPVEVCHPVDVGEFTVTGVEGSSCGNGVSYTNAIKKSCVINGPGPTIIDNTNDDMFRIEAGASSFFEFAFPGPTYKSSQLRYIESSAAEDVMMPSGPAGSFQDYVSFVTVGGTKRHPDVSVKYACGPTRFTACAGAPPQDGACHVGGPLNISVDPSTLPANQVCSVGTLFGLTGTGTAGDPWRWGCESTTGGADTAVGACQGTSALNGVCGAANGGVFADESALIADGRYCGDGSTPSYTGGAAGPWAWTCAGTGGGADASCSAAVDSGPPVCLDAGFFDSKAQVAAGACNVGATLVGPVRGDGYPTWQFTCTNGTDTRDCYGTRTITGYAPKCGSAHTGRYYPSPGMPIPGALGGPFPPTSNRCSDGGNSSSAAQVQNFTGDWHNGWTWDCYPDPSYSSPHPGATFATSPPTPPPGHVSCYACGYDGCP